MIRRALHLLTFFALALPAARYFPGTIAFADLPVPKKEKLFKTVDLLLTPRADEQAPDATPAIPKLWLAKDPEPLFLPAEQRSLEKLGAWDLAESVRLTAVTPAAGESIKAWCATNHPGWVVEENGSVALHADVDPQFFEYQWGLQNTGQPQGLVIDSNTVVPMPAHAGEDVGVKRARPQTPSQKKIVVAVLDTGLDYDRDNVTGKVTLVHQNLVGQVVDKSAPGGECDPADLADRMTKYKACVASGAKDCLTRSTVTPGVADFDRDGNGYPLDCLGWNLTGAPTAATDLLGDSNTTDKLGHGTHVAGIIAAVAGPNGEGVRGVMTQNVAILPVKVVSEAPNQPHIPQGSPIVPHVVPSAVPLPQESVLNGSKGAVGFTDQIARGVLYAIRSGANVITMSLAWPGDADSDLMKRMTKLARDQHILIVASAGNDSTESRTMPCQYSSVICVGSHDPMGNRSYFSNFGAAVDVSAPGDGILSTWPRAITGGRRWTSGLNGYEQLSGTSMSAPFVTGLLARLLDEGFSDDEAAARIMTGTRPTSIPASRLGNIDLELAEKAVAQPLIMPDPKGPIAVSWDPTSDVAPFQISFKNFWAQAQGQTQISLELETDSEPTLAGAKIETLSPVAFDSWAPMETKTVQAQLRFAGDQKQRMKLNGRFAGRIKVIVPGAAPRSFEQPFELVATITPDHSLPGASDVQVEGNPIALGADIRTVNPHDGDPTLEYVVTETAATGLTIKLYREQPAVPPLAPKITLVDQFQHAVIPNELVLADVQRVDHQIGQPSGYVLIYQTKPASGNIPGILFDFYDHDFKPVKSLHYDNIVAGIDSKHWVWIKAVDPSTAKLPDAQKKYVRVPAWIAFGLLPKEEYPDPDFYACFWVKKGEECIQGDSQMDSDDMRALPALQKKKGVTHTRAQGMQILIDTMTDTSQNHSQRNHFYFLEPVERKEHDPVTGAESGDPKAIVRTAKINPAVPSNRKLRVRGQSAPPPAAPDFHDYIPLQLLAQTAEEQKDGSVRMLLAKPEKTVDGTDVSTLQYAVGRVTLAQSTDAQGGPVWIIQDLANILKVDETRNLVGLADVITMMPLGPSSQGDPRATFMGQALDRGQYEANVVEPRGVTPLPHVGLSDVGLHVVDPPGPTDSVFRAAGVFEGATRQAMFGETHFSLQYNDFTTGEHAEENLGRFSFMQQAVFSLLLFPVVVGDEQGTELLPGMMIPAQLRSAPNGEVIIPSYDPQSGKLNRLITPARLRLQAGPGCRALSNPTVATAQSPPSLVFLCGSKLTLVPLSY